MSKKPNQNKKTEKRQKIINKPNLLIKMNEYEDKNNQSKNKDEEKWRK